MSKPYQPTGRPRGRPKAHQPGDEPVKTSIRIPRHLHTQVQDLVTRSRLDTTAIVCLALHYYLEATPVLSTLDTGLTAAMRAMAELDHPAIDTAWPVMERALAALDQLTGKASQPKEIAS